MASDIDDGLHVIVEDEVAAPTDDVADDVAAVRTMALTLERFRRLDMLVNDAGRTLKQASC